jgi:sulfoxide reductase heme-binding subunit YedZ
MKKLLASHALFWLLLAFPAAWWIYRYAAGTMAYGEVIHASGDLSVEILIVVLAITPLRLLAPHAGLAAWLMQRRRDLGVATFCYAALHLAVYAIRKADLALIVSEGMKLDLATGWIALGLFAALAITSNDQSVRWLKRGWKMLHRFVYVGAALALAHWVLTAFDPLSAYTHAGVLVGIETLRLILQAQRKAKRPS